VQNFEKAMPMVPKRQNWHLKRQNWHLKRKS